MPPSGRYMPSSSERYDIYLRGPVRPPLLFSGAPGQMRWASASGRCRTDSPIAGWVGEKHFFSRIGAIRFGTSRAFPARTRVTFPSPEKSPKGRTREGPFRWGPSLMNPTPATTQRGAPAPLWIPPPDLYLPYSSLGTPEGIRRQILSKSQSTFSALGSSLVSTYWRYRRRICLIYADLLRLTSVAKSFIFSFISSGNRTLTGTFFLPISSDRKSVV